MKPIPQPARGSVLIITMIFVGVLALSVAAYYRNLIPKFRGTYQGAAWHEALHGAEGGADYAIYVLDGWALAGLDPANFPWTSSNWSYTDSSYTTNGEVSLAASVLPVLGGPSNVRVTKVTADVYTREVIGNTPSYNPWYRIRSTARADLPGKYVSEDSRDIQLRRMKLAAKTASGADDPHVTRTVEVVVRPRYLFNKAIVTVNNMSLGNSSQWGVDSFDSQDTAKSDPGTSAGGVYPENTPSKIQSNGGIASIKTNPASSPYGPLIDGNGAVVKGDVATNGGDNPATTAFENVTGSSGMDQTRISATFSQDIPIPTAPTWSSWTYQGAAPAAFVTGTKANPTRYSITGNLGTFAVTPPLAGTTGYVEIIVSGNLNTGNGAAAGITIPPNVYAKIWVNGNIDFGNGNINSDAASSKVASHLTVLGTGPAGSVTTDLFTASGNAVEILSLYAPNYSATLNGTVRTIGSFIIKNFTISGGGGGGFHYDESLNRGGIIAGWDVASNFEDMRKDL